MASESQAGRADLEEGGAQSAEETAKERSIVV